MLLLIGAIITAVAPPKSHLKNGELNREDLLKIPKSLSNKLIMMHWTPTILLISGFLTTAPFMLYEWLLQS